MNSFSSQDGIYLSGPWKDQEAAIGWDCNLLMPACASADPNVFRRVDGLCNLNRKAIPLSFDFFFCFFQTCKNGPYCAKDDTLFQKVLLGVLFASVAVGQKRRDLQPFLSIFSKGPIMEHKKEKDRNFSVNADRMQREMLFCDKGFGQTAGTRWEFKEKAYFSQAVWPSIRFPHTPHVWLKCR